MSAVSSMIMGEKMPQRVLCHECGYVLYEGEELKPPDEILQRYDGKCPGCGRKLAFLPLNVEVEPVNRSGLKSGKL
ncbi:hypothetical protein H5T51_07730 [Candidatus Bathyarchaeota archaeon]|nr:hypothetical protein [Candidatus Bathyarchaeota archaeon]